MNMQLIQVLVGGMFFAIFGCYFLFFQSNLIDVTDVFRLVILFRKWKLPSINFGAAKSALICGCME